MIENNTTWYLGTVGDGESYKLAKYEDTNMSYLTSTTTNAKVGLLRLGELMAGQFNKYGSNIEYVLLTPHSGISIRTVDNDSGTIYDTPSYSFGAKPSMNLKSNVIITGGEGTKNNPFTIELSS